jgi:S1/P1 Nuclease
MPQKTNPFPIVIRPLLVIAFLYFASRAFAYGPLGHEIVGAIADRKLAGTDTGAKVNKLVEGMTLQRAANIADEIKAWDKKGADDPTAYPHYPKWPAIERQLREFWKANPPGPDASDTMPSHHWFHYTDVPVLDSEKYADGKTGRGNWDIVHAIPYCIAVLRGGVPEDNARKITKPLAVILLAHLVGDIHQPLHVGVEYFSEYGEPVDPDRGVAGLGDEGGNSLSFVENATAQHPRHYYHSFHAFWDLDLVRNLVIGTPDEVPKEQGPAVYDSARDKLLADFAANEPKDWRTSGDPKGWAEQWANEILPVAREAHTRVRFEHVHREEKNGDVFAKGEAREIKSDYREWSTTVVREELHKAGWRLAELLEKSL